MDFFFIFKFLILLQIVIAESKKINMQSRIYPGQAASEGTIFYAGYLSYNGQIECGGSIIHQRWALTAAHCIKEKDNPTFTVGTIHLYGPDGITYGVQEFHSHAGYYKDPGPPYINKNDIGLIRTASDIIYNDRVNFVPLARDTTANYDYQTALTVGWGSSQYGLGTSSILLYENVPIMPISECQRLFPQAYFSNDLHVCISNANRQQACNGDSGSPLVLNGEQIGIVSVVEGRCIGSATTIYTKVSTFVPWIQGVLAGFGESI